MEAILITLLIFSVTCGPFILYYIYNFRRCSMCKRRDALRWTGAEREGGGWLSGDHGAREEKCKYCGYRHWVEREDGP